MEKKRKHQIIVWACPKQTVEYDKEYTYSELCDFYGISKKEKPDSTDKKRLWKKFQEYYKIDYAQGKYVIHRRLTEEELYSIELAKQGKSKYYDAVDKVIVSLLAQGESFADQGAEFFYLTINRTWLFKILGMANEDYFLSQGNLSIALYLAAERKKMRQGKQGENDFNFNMDIEEEYRKKCPSEYLAFGSREFSEMRYRFAETNHFFSQILERALERHTKSGGQSYRLATSSVIVYADEEKEKEKKYRVLNLTEDTYLNAIQNQVLRQMGLKDESAVNFFDRRQEYVERVINTVRNDKNSPFKNLNIKYWYSVYIFCGEKRLINFYYERYRQENDNFISMAIRQLNDNGYLTLKGKNTFMSNTRQKWLDQKIYLENLNYPLDELEKASKQVGLKSRKEYDELTAQNNFKN